MDNCLHFVIRSLREYIHRLGVYTKCRNCFPYDISSFNLQSCIDDLDPLLWKMIVLLTRSAAEIGKPVQTSAVRGSCSASIIYVLFTNHKCSVPLH